MLVEVDIMVPRMPPGDGSARDQHATARAVELFGGCSWLPSVVGGFWLAPGGTVHGDVNRILRIAVDSFGDLALVVAYARELGRLYEQESMYIGALGVSECVRVSS